MRPGKWFLGVDALAECEDVWTNVEESLSAFE